VLGLSLTRVNIRIKIINNIILKLSSRIDLRQDHSYWSGELTWVESG
jgi:hypothetical protein